MAVTGQPAFPYLTSCGGLTTSALGVVSCTSDAKFKDIEGDFTVGLDALMKIDPQTYTWKKSSHLYDGGFEYNGFIAQNIQDAVPEAVNPGREGLQINTTALLAVTINAVKDLNNKVEHFELAESYHATDTSIKAGEIVALDTTSSSTIKRAGKNDTLLGVVSTAPGLLLGKKLENGRPVALKGRVPVKVNMEGGEIKAGDPITLSSVPGVGTKATTTTQIVGLAVVSTNESGFIEIFVENRMYMAPEYYAALDDFFVFGTTPTSTDMTGILTEGSFMKGFMSQIFTQVTTWFADAQNGIGNLFANSFHAKEEICVDDQCLTRDDIEALLQQVQNNASAGGGGGGGSAPEPDPEPTPEDPPADPAGDEGGGGTTESTPEPTPEPEPAPEEPPAPDPAPEPAA